MADIELVIKIPEELKSKIDNANEDNYRTYLWWFETTLYCAIKDGTPLPEGHGNIYDERDLEKLGNVYFQEEVITNDSNVEYRFPKLIINATPIIEADKCESGHKRTD